jgi:hypothetical protein
MEITTRNRRRKNKSQNIYDKKKEQQKHQEQVQYSSTVRMRKMTMRSAGVPVPTVLIVYCLLLMNSLLLCLPKSSSGNNSLVCRFEGVAAASTAPKSGRQRERAAKQQLQHRQDQQIVYSCGSVTEDPVQLTVQGGKHNYCTIQSWVHHSLFVCSYCYYYHLIMVMPVMRMGRRFQGRMLHYLFLTMNIFHS